MGRIKLDWAEEGDHVALLFTVWVCWFEQEAMLLTT